MSYTRRSENVFHVVQKLERVCMINVEKWKMKQSFFVVMVDGLLGNYYELLVKACGSSYTKGRLTQCASLLDDCWTEINGRLLYSI